MIIPGNVKCCRYIVQLLYSCPFRAFFRSIYLTNLMHSIKDIPILQTCDMFRYQCNIFREHSMSDLIPVYNDKLLYARFQNV